MWIRRGEAGEGHSDNGKVLRGFAGLASQRRENVQVYERTPGGLYFRQ